jgi:phosphohistidine phosphatase
MSKTLVIVRHGKATHDYNLIPDIDRPLKETGILGTLSVARRLKEEHVIPDFVLSSPADRALHTALVMAREFGLSYEKICLHPDIYEKSENDILSLIKLTGNQFSSLFLFGHNPDVTSLSNLFLKQHIDNLPTSGAVVLEFQTDRWTDIGKTSVRSENFYFPKSL